jgi:hypothetical protein
MRPVAVEPGEEERQFLPESRETERDKDQPPGALDLDGADASFDHRQATVLADGPESMPDAVAPTPALETLRGELSALV